MAVGLILNRNRQVPAEDTPAFAGIAERFRRAGELERAVALCRDGLKKFPDHLSARVTLGWALLDLGKYDEARAELEQALKRAPDNLAAIRGLAELHERAEHTLNLPMDGPGQWPPDVETIEAFDAIAPAGAAAPAAAVAHAETTDARKMPVVAGASPQAKAGMASATERRPDALGHHEIRPASAGPAEAAAEMTTAPVGLDSGEMGEEELAALIAAAAAAEAAAVAEERGQQTRRSSSGKRGRSANAPRVPAETAPPKSAPAPKVPEARPVVAEREEPVVVAETARPPAAPDLVIAASAAAVEPQLAEVEQAAAAESLAALEADTAVELPAGEPPTTVEAVVAAEPPVSTDAVVAIESPIPSESLVDAEPFLVAESFVAADVPVEVESLVAAESPVTSEPFVAVEFSMAAEPAAIDELDPIVMPEAVLEAMPPATEVMLVASDSGAGDGILFPLDLVAAEEPLSLADWLPAEPASPDAALQAGVAAPEMGATLLEVQPELASEPAFLAAEPGLAADAILLSAELALEQESPAAATADFVADQELRPAFAVAADVDLVSVLELAAEQASLAAPEQDGAAEIDPVIAATSQPDVAGALTLEVTEPEPITAVHDLEIAELDLISAAAPDVQVAEHGRAVAAEAELEVGAVVGLDAGDALDLAAAAPELQVSVTSELAVAASAELEVEPAPELDPVFLVAADHELHDVAAVEPEATGPVFALTSPTLEDFLSAEEEVPLESAEWEDQSAGLDAAFYLPLQSSVPAVDAYIARREAEEAARRGLVRRRLDTMLRKVRNRQVTLMAQSAA